MGTEGQNTLDESLPALKEAVENSLPEKKDWGKSR